MYAKHSLLMNRWYVLYLMDKEIVLIENVFRKFRALCTQEESKKKASTKRM